MTVHTELLCVADTKLVMGNWLAKTVMNGRALPDFAAILGMCTTSYGQTRALYQFVAGGYEAYSHLERGRDRHQIHSMNLLDAPPGSWEDLVITVWLAERATWTMMANHLGGDDRRIAALARKVGEEAYFHLKYATGWFKVLAADEESRQEMESVLAARLPLALDWFGSLTTSRESFLLDVTEEMKALGIVVAADGAPPEGEWREDARRRGPLPESLFEVIRFKDAAMAH